MIAYTVHEPLFPQDDIVAQSDAHVFVKEGILWSAVIFQSLGVVLWLLYHRMFMVLAAYFVALIVLAMGLGFAGLGAGFTMIVLAIFNIGFALEARNLQRWTLGSDGYKMIAAITGRNLGECQHKFYSAWLPGELDMSQISRVADRMAMADVEHADHMANMRAKSKKSGFFSSFFGRGL